ncbi:SDR family NAD(P)-dependent oxidoreductase [Noviherbaspirillum denitrificans]|uniref:3-oxoacyl-ACP reductase n=1 Tax=Noviherbaspirillum denitrificans TaxID=1968433 RepID=A0A254TG27_9BURK|nr:SDR family NAD(P)-dependent oxidoreductase [Noviherbaspirillum denitrificans]OWW21616.1 3-oxoacyl-ACP reductase [Noviherbaspirillum denitrificans]
MIRGRTAIVTGAARGIGLGIARRLAADGCRVVLWDLDFSRFDVGTAGFEPLLLQTVDVTDAAAVEAAFAVARETAGTIDILVNNAGIIGPIVPAWEVTPDAWRRVMAVNLDGVYHCCRAAAPHMRDNGHGRIVNIASVAGKEGNPNNSAYAAAKAGVIGFSKSLARELAASGVLVNCIAPTMAETDLLAGMTPEFIAMVKGKIPMGRLACIEEIAAMTTWIAGPECSFTTGFVFDLSGGRATY